MGLPPRRAIVIGASGGIGAALVRGLEARGRDVTGLSRTTRPPLDVSDQASIAAAAESLRAAAPFDTILVATGLLHDGALRPEKSLADLDADQLARSFAVNAIGPALVARHFVPLLPRHGRAIFAALSARVGSISDNRLGGWYGYRASKAALNQLIRTLAIELARTRPGAICVGLHPGTVDTRLSAPFQRGVAPDRLFTPERSAGHLLDVLDRLAPDQSGRCFAWDGSEIAP
ncbi:SDR family NAD(P)-dependent oxidoreductase [Sphingomonas mesophila]|uniref:SDR family NAD(P)-dependent oxidoreductase n=1 Tax=Sphingomonas mesophila TaxID=2303576 RepID=UPI000E594792|nr:SDR family NAD(P)-dependent oxidoreductase [Sphingomonas mesophila]